MPFFKLTCASSLLAVTLLSACSQSPTKNTDNTSDRTHSGGTSEITENNVSYTATPNPYLNNPVKASANAKQRFKKALAYMQNEQWQAAIIDFNTLIQDFPELSGPYLNIGIAYRKIDQTDKAITSFNKAINANELNVFAYNQLALLQRQEGDFQAALENYQQALKIWPDYYDANLNIGILYDLYFGDKNLALNHYLKAEKLIPSPSRKLRGWIVDLQRQQARGQ